MQLPSLSRAVRLAEARLTVLSQATGRYEPFILTSEQRGILATALRTRRLVVGKGRQVGCSTVLVYLLMLAAIMNPGLPIVIVADEQEKAEALLSKVKAWLAQLNRHLVVDNVRSIQLKNGATIEARSAISRAASVTGESRVGRSKSYGVVYATEMAFWENARAVWASLTSTALATAAFFVDSTGTPGETLFRGLVEGGNDDAEAANEDWERLFIGVEEHESYRADPTLISDETWARLQEDHRFTRRDSAAWWHRKLRVDFNGDTSRMLREFPVVFDHMFTFREGQHISRWVDAAVRVDGAWNVYVEQPDEPLVLGVDTGAGIGQDASSLAFIGHRTGRLVRTWRSNTLPIPGFISFVDQAITDFAPVATLVESNGVGAVVYQAVSHRSGVEEQKSGAGTGEVQERRDRLRDSIESGDVPIGGHLIEEARSSTVRAKRREDGSVRAVFEGMDDVLSATSFARKWREANPWRQCPLEPTNRYDQFVPRRQLRKRQQGTPY